MQTGNNSTKMDSEVRIDKYNNNNHCFLDSKTSTYWSFEILKIDSPIEEE